MHFASDNSGPVHPHIMQALAQANEGWALPYGNDDWTRSAIQKVRDIFEAPEASVFLTATGTSANALVLGTLAQPFQTIFCTKEAHIHEDECNAPEFYTGGAKLTLIDSHDARMDPDALASQIRILKAGGVHSPLPGPVSITTVTERGTVYSIDQIRALAQVAQAHECPLHLDGARFANAMVALDASPAEMTWRAGVDAVSFGGTKNGCMGVEAVVIFDPALAQSFAHRRKRAGHLFSKSRYLGAQIDAYLTDDLWITLAGQSNDAAARLASALKAIPGTSFLWEREANMLFTNFPRAAHRRLTEAGAQYNLWDGTLDGDPNQDLAARLVCDWSCRDEDIARFCQLVRG